MVLLVVFSLHNWIHKSVTSSSRLLLRNTPPICAWISSINDTFFHQSGILFRLFFSPLTTFVSSCSPDQFIPYECRHDLEPMSCCLGCPEWRSSNVCNWRLSLESIRGLGGVGWLAFSQAHQNQTKKESMLLVMDVVELEYTTYRKRMKKNRWR